MHSSSVFNLFTAGLACFAPLASAWTQPKGNAPEGNPITQPGLNEIVPAGQAYTITWTPTTQGTVTLLLLKGPGNNAVPQYPIIEKTANTGKFSWKVPTTLEPGTTGYGIELIDDATGQYQFTTQFGISNPAYEKGSASDPSSSSAGAGASTSSPASVSSSSSSSANSTATATTSTATDPTTTLVKSHATAPSASGSGHAGTATVILPTKPMTVPASLVTATSTAPLPTVTALGNSNATVSGPVHGNGAGQLATGLAGVLVAAAVAVIAF